jgi:uncharacterized membrane protein
MNLLDYKNETVQIIYLVAAFVVLFIIFQIIRWYNNRKSVESKTHESVASFGDIYDLVSRYGLGHKGGRRMRKKNSKNKNKNKTKNKI